MSGIDGAEPTRSGGGVSPTPLVPSTSPGTPTQPVQAPGAVRSTGTATNGNREQFHSPDLTSGLLSDNITGWQREDLSRLARLLRMQPRGVLDVLRSGANLAMLLSARRISISDIRGMFGKGLLVDAQC